MKKNDDNIDKQEISKQIENSLELLILYRSLYIIKQKFSLFKERIKNIYDKYNIYQNNFKLNTDIKIYQINKKDFVQVTDEVLKDLNLILINYSNPKDIFLSKVIQDQKIKENISIIQEILNWLTNNTNNNNGKNTFKNYNKIFFNKKIKPFIQNIKELENINTESNIDGQKNELENSDFQQNFSQKTYVQVMEYDRRGHLINAFKSKICDENEETGEATIETIDINKIQKNENKVTNKELSVLLNGIDEFNGINKSNSNNNNFISNDFLYVESLPLILAEFIQANLNYAIVETEDELGKELKVLFDNEILKRLNEFDNVLKDKLSIINNISNNNLSKEEKQKKELDNALEDRKKIKDNIKIYKDILENKKKLNENVDYIEKMIEKLMTKEIWLEHRIKLLYEKDKNYMNIINTNNNLNNTNNIGRVTGNTGISDISLINNDTNKNITNINNNKTQIYNNTSMNKQFNESITNSLNTNLLNDKSNTSIVSNSSKVKINNALQDIFIYYSKQHIIAGYTPLFSNLEKKHLHLDLQEFSKFCVDFRIPILRQKLVEIFKKTTTDFHHMSFKEFKNAIISLANATHESKQKSLKEIISNKKNELNTIELKEKRIKEEKKLQRLLYNNEENENNIQNTNNHTNKNKNNNGGSHSRSPSGKTNLVLQKKNLFNDISNCKIKYNNENKKTYQEIIDNFYEFLGLYSTQEYRSKIRGYNMSPVKTVANLNHEKSFLSGDGNRSKSFKNEEIDEINKMVEDNRNKRIKKEIKDKERIKKLLCEEKLKLFNINNQRLKITIDKKMKKKTYLDLMKEKNEEKSEILLMQQQQENNIKNKLKERELQKSKEKERLKELKKNNYKREESKDNINKSKDISISIIEDKNKNINLNNNIDNKENNYHLNKIINEKEINQNKLKNEINKENEEEEIRRRNDKNQIWWEKLESYDINDLGMNEEEKDIFMNSENSEDNDISKIKVNSHNNSFGGLISDNSLHKSSSITDLNNKENNKNGPIQLPPISGKKSSLKKENKVIQLNTHGNQRINKNNSIDTFKNQIKNRSGLDEIKNRIINGNNKKENNNRYKNMFKNNSTGLIKNTQNNKSENNIKNIKRNEK